MNEATFLIAVLYKKGLLSKPEAAALRDMAQSQTFSASLQEMIKKVEVAFDKAYKKDISDLEEIDAVDLYKNS